MLQHGAPSSCPGSPGARPAAARGKSAHPSRAGSAERREEPAGSSRRGKEGAEPEPWPVLPLPAPSPSPSPCPPLPGCGRPGWRRVRAGAELHTPARSRLRPPARPGETFPAAPSALPGWGWGWGCPRYGCTCGGREHLGAGCRAGPGRREPPQEEEVQAGLVRAAPRLQLAAGPEEEEEELAAPGPRGPAPQGQETRGAGQEGQR